MNRFLLLSTIGLATLAASLAVAPRVQAETIDEAEFGSLEVAPGMSSVTSVSQLTDVKPTDWAFQALQSLVERYGCIAGYPDKTYRGNRAMTRYEFAAGLNACMNRGNDLIAASTADMVKKEDLATLRKLQEQFSAELSTLRGRVDSLETKTALLEKQQFSTTSKLNGEVVIGLAGVATGRISGSDISRNTVMGYRARLNIDTSFTGEDLLRTRIQAGNSDFTNAATGISEGSLRMAANSGSRASIDALLYQFPLGKNTTITLEANAGAIDDFTDTLNPYLDGDGGSGALSHFGTRNPIYYLMGGTGIGVKHNFGEKLELSAGYLAGSSTNSAASPTAGSGLFNGPYGIMGQVTFKPSDRLKVGVTYVNSYNTDFASAGNPTGSTLANPFTAGLGNTSSNSIGGGGSFQISDGLVLNANAGYTRTNVITVGDLDIWNWSVGLALPDFGKKGNVAGLIVGMEPKVTNATGGLARDTGTSIHVEGFYQYRVNDNISITPGIIWLTTPDHNSANSGAIIGAIRSTFTF
ncbi:MAG: iron uptake porin [Cyanobacteria bacterium]|nr:iron uptake porin [Cyanobacteriota bacterium]